MMVILEEELLVVVAVVRTADGSDWGEGGGGSPRVVVRYRIDADNANFVASSVATGGYVSYTPTNTVHTFFTPGSFVAPTSLTISFLLVGGGGGGGTDNGGGGGGGEVVVGTSYPLPLLPMQLQLVMVVQEVMEIIMVKQGQEKLDTLLHLTHSLLVVAVAVVRVLMSADNLE